MRKVYRKSLAQKRSGAPVLSAGVLTIRNQLEVFRLLGQSRYNGDEVLANDGGLPVVGFHRLAAVDLKAVVAPEAPANHSFGFCVDYCVSACKEV